MNRHKAKVVQKDPKHRFDSQNPKGWSDFWEGRFFVDLQIQPDRSEVRGSWVEPQMIVLGFGPFEGFMGKLSIEAAFFRAFLAEKEVHRRKQNDPGKESEDGNLRLENGNLGKVPVVHDGPDFRNKVVEGLGIVQIGRRRDKGQCPEGVLEGCKGVW